MENVKNRPFFTNLCKNFTSMTPLNIANDIGIVEFLPNVGYFLLNIIGSASFLAPSTVYSNSTKTLINPCIILEPGFLVLTLDLDYREPNELVLKCSKRKRTKIINPTTSTEHQLGNRMGRIELEENCKKCATGKVSIAALALSSTLRQPR